MNRKSALLEKVTETKSSYFVWTATPAGNFTTPTAISQVTRRMILREKRSFLSTGLSMKISVVTGSFGGEQRPFVIVKRKKF